MYRAVRLALVLAVLSGCRSKAEHSEWSGRREVSGDTTIVTTVAGSVWGQPSLVVDSVSIVWQSDSLDRPGVLLLVGSDHLLIAERDRIHLITTGGTLVSEIGRKGDGPGEFRALATIGVLGDTILAYDAVNNRLSRFSGDGRFLSASTLTPPREMAPGRQPLAIRPWNGGFFFPWSDGMVHLGDPPMQHGLGWSLLTGDSTHLVATLAGSTWTQAGPMLSPTELFAPNPIAATSRDGRFAYADGLDYCIVTGRANSVAVTRVCREWHRVPVTETVRHPDFTRLATRAVIDPGFRTAIEEGGKVQHVGDRWNSIRDIRFDDKGQLWVNVVDSATAVEHPFLMNRYAELRPKHYAWDVYGDDGRLLGEVELPSRFSPREFDRGTIYGIYELDSGEQAIGSVTLPREVRK